MFTVSSLLLCSDNRCPLWIVQQHKKNIFHIHGNKLSVLPRLNASQSVRLGRVYQLMKGWIKRQCDREHMRTDPYIYLAPLEQIGQECQACLCIFLLWWSSFVFIDLLRRCTGIHTQPCNTRYPRHPLPIWCSCSESILVFATRATPRLLILAETGDWCYRSVCSCLKGMTASKDEIFLFASGPCAAEAFIRVRAIGRPHINCELSDLRDNGGYWLSCALWGVVVEIILGAPQVSFNPCVERKGNW